VSTYADCTYKHESNGPYVEHYVSSAMEKKGYIETYNATNIVRASTDNCEYNINVKFKCASCTFETLVSNMEDI